MSEQNDWQLRVLCCDVLPDLQHVGNDLVPAVTVGKVAEMFSVPVTAVIVRNNTQIVRIAGIRESRVARRVIAKTMQDLNDCRRLRS